MKRIKYFYLTAVTVFAALSCTEKELTPISDSTGKPEKVTVLNVERIPGGAIISYRIPEKGDILAVKAAYTLSSGKKMEATTSFYDNELEIVGYNDTARHEVTLYSINRAQEYSDPEIVVITPMESPLSKAANSMAIVSDFGGANFSWRNEYRANLSLEFLAENTDGDLQTVRVLTSTLDSLSFTIRGYEPKPTKFGVIISDNYGNETSTITPKQPVVPIFEQKLDKSIQRIRILAGDVSMANWEGRNEALIDDDLTTFGHSPNGPNGRSEGLAFTLDLGKTAKISRFIQHQREDGNRYYRNGNSRVFEVYAYAGVPFDTDDPNGDWSNWEKVATCEIIKPSGLSEVTDEDRLYASNGHEFALPLSMDPVRYLRFRVLTTWQNDYWHPAEFTVFGVYDE
jgi:hypothetical protein